MIRDGKNQKQFSCTQPLPEPADEADREMSRLLEGFRAFNTGGIPVVFVTGSIHPASKEKENPNFDSTKAKDLCGQMNTDEFDIVNKNEVCFDANTLGGD